MMTIKRSFSTQQLAIMAVLIAMNIILSRVFSIAAWNLKIGFSFLPVVIAAIYLGPKQAAAVGALGDFLGATLLPIAAYFPGFTLTAALNGLIYGFFLYKKHGWKQIFGAVLASELICSLILNTLWISILFNSPFLPLIATRVIQVLVMVLVECIVIHGVMGILVKIQNSLQI